MTVCVVDYGAGNLRSLRTGLERAGAGVTVTDDPTRVAAAARVLVPGVGAAGAAMAALERRGLAAAIRDVAAAGGYVFGICLGLQLLFDGSDEDGAETFGIIPGRTTLLRDAPTLPHIGWNQVDRVRDHVLFAGVRPGADFYFVHSYAGSPAEPDASLATTTHGARFVSAVARDNVVGVQFHPERSGADGLRFLGNAVKLLRAGSWDAGRVPAGVA